jgi:hypothetical protein
MNKLTEENLALKATVEMQAKALSAAERWKSVACNALRVAQQQLQHSRLRQMQNCSAPQHLSTSAGFIAPSAAGGSLQQAHPLPMLPETGADTYGSRVSPQYLNHPGPRPVNNEDSPSSSEVHPQVLHNSNYNSVQQQQELIQTGLKVVVEQEPNTKLALGKRLMDDSWLTVDGATGNGCVQPQPHKQARIERVNEAWSEDDLWQLLGLPLEVGNGNCAQPASHKQARELLDPPFEMDAFDDLQPHAATSDGTVSAAAGSFMTMSAAQQSDVDMTSIPVHNSTAYAYGVQTDELYTSIATFGTGGGTGVQPESSQIEISGNATGHKEDSEVWSIQTCDEATTATEETMFCLLSIYWQYGLVLVTALPFVARRAMLEFDAAVSNGVGSVLDNTDKIETTEGSGEHDPFVVANEYLVLWCSLCYLGSVGCWYLPTSVRNWLASVSFETRDARVLTAVHKKVVLPVFIMIPLLHMAFSIRRYMSTGNILEAVIDFIRRPTVLLTAGMVWLESPAESFVRVRQGLIYILSPTYIAIRLWRNQTVAQSEVPFQSAAQHNIGVWWFFMGSAVLKTSLIEHLQASPFVLPLFLVLATERYHPLWALSMSVVALLFTNLLVSSSVSVAVDPRSIGN